MKKYFYVALVLVLFSSASVMAQEATFPNTQKYVADEVIIKFTPTNINLQRSTWIASMKNFAVNQELHSETILPVQNISVMKIEDGQSVTEVIQDLQNDPNIDYVQPNFIYSTQSTLPNDSYFGNQRWLYNTGQTICWTTGSSWADIARLQAMDIRSWNSNQDTTGTIVAVIDDGLRYSHPEFSWQLRDGTTCLSYTWWVLWNCIFGFDFFGMDLDPAPAGTNTHGTHVAGTIWAKWFNGTWVVGVNPGAKIMWLRAGSGNDLDTVDIIKAFSFARTNGAKIINASRWGAENTCWAAFDEALYEAIQDFPWLVIVAAGNSHKEHLNWRYVVPADYNTTTSCRDALDNIVTVAASDNTDHLTSFSDYGSNIDIAAPGRNIKSTILTNGYAYGSWTSMATPHVVWLASLAWSMRPELNYLDIKNAIINYASSVDTLSGTITSGRRLDAYATLYYLSLSNISHLQLFKDTGSTQEVLDNEYISGSQIYVTWTPPVFLWTLSGYTISLTLSWNTIVNSGITTTWIMLSLEQDGVYQISVYPEFIGWATGDALSIAIGRDTTEPTTTTLSPVSPLRNGNLSRTPANDTWIGVTRGYYNYEIYLSGWLYTVIWTRPTTWVSLNLPYNGEYTILLSVCDELDNCSAITTWTFTINKPLSLTFAAQTNKELSTNYVSNEVTMTGLITGATVIIQWWLYSINNWTGQTGTGIIYNGDKITISLTSSSSYSSTTSATLNIGGLTWIFSITTKANPGGGWGGGGGWSFLGTCVSNEIVCSWTTYVLRSWANCQWGDLWKSCILTNTGSTWNNVQIILFGDTVRGSIAGSTFSPELNQAYLYAYQIGITTMPTIQQANIEWSLIRSHMAKMMVNYAVKVLELQPDTWANCRFDDIDHLNAELKWYITLACQLHLMGVWIHDFNPDGEVTRAQFGTVLSRTLYGWAYNNEWAKYYIDHLNALKANGIITNTSPEIQELRGRVMLMLMRAAE